MAEPTTLPGIRLITVSGRIASGSTTLAKHLAEKLSWKHIEGGEIFWEAVREKLGLDTKDTNLRPDEEDQLFDAKLEKIIASEKNIVLETKLAGFFARNTKDVFKILVICEHNGEDQPQIRIDRLTNREGKRTEEAKEEVLHREKSDVEKWRKLYAGSDENWVYWDEKYYDLIINTYNHSKEQTLHTALEALSIK